MRVWIVGSGTLIPDAGRGAPGHWLEARGLSLLLDCGAGTLRSLARLGRRWDQVTHILLTHFHTDHVGELAALLFALKHGLSTPRSAPLRLLGPRGLRQHLASLRDAHGSYVLDPGFPVETAEVGPDACWEEGPLGLRIRTAKTPHTETSLAFRVEVDGDVLGYTGDTGPQPDLGDFFQGSGALIAECSHGDRGGQDLHLSPSSLASLARRARPRVLVTVHTYPPLDPRAVPEMIAKAGYGGRVVAGEDGLCLELGGETVIVRGSLQEEGS